MLRRHYRIIHGMIINKFFGLYVKLVSEVRREYDRILLINRLLAIRINLQPCADDEELQIKYCVNN